VTGFSGLLAGNRKQPHFDNSAVLFRINNSAGTVLKPNSQTAMLNLAVAFSHYNEYHQHSVLEYRLPRNIYAESYRHYKRKNSSG